MSQKVPKIFISHASKGKNYVSLHCSNFLEFYRSAARAAVLSSVPGYGFR